MIEQSDRVFIEASVALALPRSDQGVHALISMEQLDVGEARESEVLAELIEREGPAAFGADEHIDCEQRSVQ